MTKNIGHKGLTVALAVAALFIAQPAVAVPLYLTDGDKITLDWGAGTAGHGFGGGEFMARGVLGKVLKGPGDSFLTFCVEYPEHIALGTSYYVKINTGAVNGGLGVNGTYPGDPSGWHTVGTTPGFDPLSKATAWLYTQFRNHTLDTSHGVSYNFVQDNAHANSLQLAIWSLENELSIATTSGTTSFAFNNDAVAKNWASVAKTQGALWSNTGNVRVLNLYDTYDARTGVFSGNHQDQLYMMPVPEPETYAMLLAGLGLIGFTARRRQTG